MAEPEEPEDFESFEAEGLRLYLQRTLISGREELEFLIPGVGRFTLRRAPHCAGDS